jgi:hypothetical protein
MIRKLKIDAGEVFSVCAVIVMAVLFTMKAFYGLS